MKREISFSLIAILLSCLIGFILIFCAYSIPVTKIRINANESLPILIEENEIFTWTTELTGSGIDNFTTAIMLNNASFLGRDSIIYDAIMNPRIQHPVSNKLIDLYYNLNQQTLDDSPIIDYPRYWHGYLIILKPLLLVLNLKEIRILNYILQTILLIMCLYLITKRLNIKYALAFLTSIIYLNPISLGMCLQFTSTYYIMLITTILLLFSNKQTNCYKLFLFSGIATAYFDLLSAPLITLGFPLIIYLNLYNQKLSKNFINIIKNSTFWSIGYALMWISKWIIATIITKQNILLDGFNNSLYRIKGNGFIESGIPDWTPTNAIVRNLNEYYNYNNIIIFLSFLLLICLSYLIKQYNFTKNYKAILSLFIGCYPFLWYATVINHSIIHPILTHRILAITIFAICNCIVCTLKDKENINNVHKGGFLES